MRQIKNNLKSIDFLLKTCNISEDEAANKLLIQSNIMCIVVSNMANEMFYKEKAYKRRMENWETVAKVNKYHAGICCTVLNIIQSKMRVYTDQLVSINQERFKTELDEAVDSLTRFEARICFKELDVEMKLKLLDVHLKTMGAALYFLSHM